MGLQVSCVWCARAPACDGGTSALFDETLREKYARLKRTEDAFLALDTVHARLCQLEDDIKKNMMQEMRLRGQEGCHG